MDPFFDRFDICEAWYLYLSYYPGGQWSEEYRKLCKLTDKMRFKPRPNLRRAGDLTENGKLIFKNLVTKGIKCR